MQEGGTHSQGQAPKVRGGRDSVLQGTVDRVTYRHPDSGYTVLKIAPERGFGDPQGDIYQPFGERVTAVGNGPEIAEGLRLLLHGSWAAHPRHGRQFQFVTSAVLPPLDPKGLVRYLASDTFPGIGPTLAGRIVEALGTGALAKIRADPTVLDAVQGLRPAIRESLVERVQSELGARESLAFLYGVGLGPIQAEKVLRGLGPNAEEKLRENPYLLAAGIEGIGFGLADRVARELGMATDAPERRAAALLHALREAAGKGHALQSLDELAAAASELLAMEQPIETWRGDAEALAEAGFVRLDESLIEDKTLVYLPAYHVAECGLARNLAMLQGIGDVRSLATEATLAQAEERSGLELHPSQRAAVLGALSEPVALLTGGPGVGKTTIVRLVVQLAEAESLRVVLASPTGRAAKRLAEATGRDASTIHRLLGWEPGTGRFAHHDGNPLEADLVVVDEISMLDVILAYHLSKAIQPPTRLLLVGDPHQLPSVSAGNVLADLLKSGRLPAFRLTQIYRQGAESLIVANAHRILDGELPVLPGKDAPETDFYFFAAETEEETAERLVEVVTERIPTRFGMDWNRDVQVLSPMYRGAAGVDALNARLREAQGTGGREISWRDRIWRVGDRVIHTRNDYDKHVFNGDMGRIEAIEASGAGLTVRFPERVVGYRRAEFSDLQPAFAITVHRAQGGEFRAVVIPLVLRHHTMLQRHLLYTAITRGKELVVLVGSKRALRRAIDNDEVTERRSALSTRLVQALDS